MNILLTGSTGYIGRRLLQVLLEDGHQLVCLVREKRRFDFDDFSEDSLKHITVVEADLTKPDSLLPLPFNLDVAYYLVHSMSSSGDFTGLESQSAENFVGLVNATSVRQIIYLSGLVNDEGLSKHLASRRNVEVILKEAKAKVTVFRAAIIIGSGSASFEIIRDLVEKLPLMIAPRWLKSRCQPLGVRNVIEYLRYALLNVGTFDQTFDIGGPDILSYKDMLMGYARVRGLKRLIIPVPVLSPRLSSHWLYFVTSTSFRLAKSLVSSMKNEVICRDDRIKRIIPLNLQTYEEMLQTALDKVENRNVISSWKDSFASDTVHRMFKDHAEVPVHGCLTDKQTVEFTRPSSEVIENIWTIGGERGWYVGNWMWAIRGVIDQLNGGVGLRRGRRDQRDLKAGDALDFWRVLVADKSNGRLLLFAEMKLPGEAWLEFVVSETGTKKVLTQTATFRPLGLWGRLYWYSVLPFHGFIFPEMAKRITKSPVY